MQIFNTILKLLKVFIFIGFLSFSACSNKKNTFITRTFHNLTAKYNLYFNANESLKAGIKKAKKTYKEDYSKILPIFIYDDKAVSAIMTSEMDRSIKKCAKTIKIHSLKVKPKKKKTKKISKKELEFYSKPEYCKWIDDTYLLMGIAHFYKMEYETAKLTFQLVLSKYKKEDSKYDALLWLAKTDVQTENYEEAVKTLKILKKEKKRPDYLNHEMDLLYAHLYMKQKRYKLAIPKIKTSIENEKNKKDRARLIYILAQIYKKEEKFNKAAEKLLKVIKLNPNYDMTFSAKLRLAEISEKIDNKGKDLKSELLKMAKDEKNIDYLDQIYYALGKIELDAGNTPKAIEYFSLSANSQSSSKTQKVKTYLVLSNYYYSNNNYPKAEAYFDSTLISMNKSYPDYEVVSKDIKSFKGISHNINVIHREDSLIALAKMPEAERNKIINKKIQQVIKEENEKKAKEQSEAFNPFLSNQNNNSNQNTTKSGTWYFYNPTSLSYGQTEFKKRWGDRKLEDNWRRKNKSIQVDLSETNDTSEQGENSKEPKFNNKKKEFYLKNIPLTEEMLVKSNKRIEDAYYNNGEIYYKNLSEKENSINSFTDLLKRYPKTDHRLETLYHLYQLNTETGNIQEVEKYKNIIIQEFPKSFYAKIITDPEYLNKLNAKTTKANELYKQAYTFYKDQKYAQSIDVCDKSLKDVSNIELDPNFMFLKAMSYGELGNKAKLKENLDTLVSKFPDKDITKDAKSILAVINSGKLDMDIYFNELDSIHYYLLIVAKGKVNMNSIKFNIVSFNVDNYTQSNLIIDTDSTIENKEIIIIKSFKNSAFAKAYLKLLKSKKVNGELAIIPHNQFIISKNNYEIFLKDKNIDKYLKFYNKNY